MDELLEEISSSLDEDQQQHPQAGHNSYATSPSSSSSSSFSAPPQPSDRQLSVASRQRHQQQRQPSLANWAESGLYVWTNAARWLGAFERYGWTFTPLHPSVLSEDGLRSVLGGPGGSRYGSPPSSSSSSSFSSSSSSSPSPSSSSTSSPPAAGGAIGPAVFELNLHTALAHGAIILGDEAHAGELFDRARKALEDLLDVDDYAVAEALFALGYYLYGRGDLVRFSYYITLARDMCQRLGACNSGVFLKCMLATVLDPSYTPAEKERILRRYNRAAKDTPRWNDRHDRFLLDYHQNNQQHTQQHTHEHDATASITLGVVGGTGGGEVTTHEVLDTVERLRNIDKCITNTLMLVQVHRWMRQEAEAGRGLGQDAMDTVLQQWRRLLIACKEEIDSTEALPSTFKLTVTLSWLCFSAEYQQRVGNLEEAQRLGVLYLEHVRDSSMELCTSSCINMCEIMMDLFFERGRDDMVEALLVNARSLFDRYPVCRERTAAYWARLEARRASMAANDGRQSSFSARRQPLPQPQPQLWTPSPTTQA